MRAEIKAGNSLSFSSYNFSHPFFILLPPSPPPNPCRQPFLSFLSSFFLSVTLPVSLLSTSSPFSSSLPSPLLSFYFSSSLSFLSLLLLLLDPFLPSNTLLILFLTSPLSSSFSPAEAGLLLLYWPQGVAIHFN